MQTSKELMGEDKSLDLPREMKFLRSGYTKYYAMEPEKLFEAVSQVIVSLAGQPIIIFKEDKAGMQIEGAFHQFVKFRNPREVKDYQPRADYTPLARFNLKISVVDTNLTDHKEREKASSRLIFCPSTGLNASTPSRAFFHLHAVEFFRRVDDVVNSIS
jgi:hypothetical protein